MIMQRMKPRSMEPVVEAEQSRGEQGRGEQRKEGEGDRHRCAENNRQDKARQGKA